MSDRVSCANRLSAWSVCLVCAAWLVAGGSALAQSVATISGQVTDASGAVLPGATVEILNEDTGITRTVVSDAEGRYRVRDLTLGRYRISGSLTGFTTVVRSGVV